MKTVVLYESMFGNTRQVAEAIAEGLGESSYVEVCPIGAVSAMPLAEVDIVVVGAPTHAHTLSTPASRADAKRQAANVDHHLTLEPDATGAGIREWIEAMQPGSGAFAAFDTRTDIPRILSGAASARIDRELRKRGMHAIVPPESFTVSRENRLDPGERERAHQWGATIAHAQ